jgi:tetratricopeptide (TPR) repeat protein
MAEAGLPGSVDVLTLKAELLLRQREWDASLATRERAALLDPLNPETGMNLAMAYAEMDRWGEADAVFDRILEVHPGFLEAAFTRGWYWWRRTGDEGPGRAALAGLPDDVSVFGLRTFFEWMMTEDPEEKAMALERIEEPISEFGGFWWAPRSLLEGWTYRTLDSERAGRAFARAVEDCLSGLEELPDDPRIYASLGRAQAGLGRREEAIEAAERVVELLPMDRDPVFGRDLLEFVSTIYAELGMAEEAAEAMEQVLSVPVVPPMFALLGPEFELVRDHPRFRAIIRRYPIPPER